MRAGERGRDGAEPWLRETESLPQERVRERDRYLSLFELAPDACVLTDASGVIEDVNSAAEALLRRPRGLLVGSRLGEYLRGADGELDRALAELLRERALAEVELSLHARGASPRDVGVTGAADSGADGRGARLCWIVRDITERKRAQRKLREANAELERCIEERTAQLEVLARAQDDLVRELGRERGRLEAVLQQMPGGTIITEAPSGNLLLANEEAERILGMSVVAPDVLGSASLGGLGDDGRPYRPGDWPLSRSLLLGEVVNGELVDVVRSDASRVTLEVNAAPVRDPAGTIIAGVVTFYDVSAREHRARAERDFVTNAAHELRTPLAAIVSSMEVLQAGAKERADARDRFLSHIDLQCRRLQRLVHALLVLARIEMGEEPATLETIPLAPLLDDLARNLEPNDGVSIHVRCARDIAAVADRALLEEVLANLGSNAAKYAERGAIELVAASADGRAVIEVRDTGPGMSEEERDRAFERFYRGAEQSGGFGLGLAIAAQAVEMLGGTIAIDSAFGPGTTVRVTLPSAELP